MRAMMMVVVGVLGLGVTLAGCGPSALEQRACEMWGDEGGSPKSVEQWRAHFSQPEWRATEQADETPESRAQAQYKYAQQINQEAKARVSRRLSLSLREVNEALKKCPDSAHLRTVQPASN